MPVSPVMVTRTEDQRISNCCGSPLTTVCPAQSAPTLKIEKDVLHFYIFIYIFFFNLKFHVLFLFYNCESCHSQDWERSDNVLQIEQLQAPAFNKQQNLSLIFLFQSFSIDLSGE